MAGPGTTAQQMQSKAYPPQLSRCKGALGTGLVILALATPNAAGAPRPAGADLRSTADGQLTSCQLFLVAMRLVTPAGVMRCHLTVPTWVLSSATSPLWKTPAWIPSAPDSLAEPSYRCTAECLGLGTEGARKPGAPQAAEVATKEPQEVRHNEIGGMAAPDSTPPSPTTTPSQSPQTAQSPPPFVPSNPGPDPPPLIQDQTDDQNQG
jgi:hypothetical protein